MNDNTEMKRHIEITRNLFNSIPDKGNIKTLIAYHGDCDGCISSALVGYILEIIKPNCKKFYMPVRTEEFDFVAVLEYVQKNNPDISIFLDISIHNYPRTVNAIKNSTNLFTFIYDHHRGEGENILEDFVYLNSAMKENGEYDPSSPPPCLFAYELCLSCTKSNPILLPAMGLICESSVGNFPHIFHSLKNKYPELFENPENLFEIDDIKNSKLQKLAYAVNSVFWGPSNYLENKVINLLSRYIEKNDYPLFFHENNSDLNLIFENSTQIEGSISIWEETIRNSLNDIEVLPIVYSEINSNYRINGVVATRLSYTFLKSLIIITQVYNDRFIIEIRRGRHLESDVSKLLKEIISDLSAISVGGHPFAAGAVLFIGERINFIKKVSSLPPDYIDKLDIL